MQRSRDVCHQSLHLTGHIRVLALELLLHVVSRLCDQLLEEMPGDVLTTTELLDENRIALGAFDHVQNTKLRKARAVVCCDRVNHLPIPSSHKHVRYVRANGLSPRYCEQMQLAFGPGISNQGSSIEPLGMTKSPLKLTLAVCVPKLSPPPEARVKVPLTVQALPPPALLVRLLT